MASLLARRCALQRAGLPAQHVQWKWLVALASEMEAAFVDSYKTDQDATTPGFPSMASEFSLIQRSIDVMDDARASERDYEIGGTLPLAIIFETGQ